MSTKKITTCNIDDSIKYYESKFSNLIKALLKQYGGTKTQDELAKEAGVSQTQINHLVYNNRPLTINSLLKLLPILGISFADFFNEGPIGIEKDTSKNPQKNFAISKKASNAFPFLNDLLNKIHGTEKLHDDSLDDIDFKREIEKKTNFRFKGCSRSSRKRFKI